MRIAEYLLLMAADPVELTRLVNERIAVGWEPLGSPLVTTCDGRTSLFQAVARFAEDSGRRYSRRRRRGLDAMLEDMETETAIKQ